MVGGSRSCFASLNSLSTVAQMPERVLILGGGVNGAATARELVLNGISVCVVDAADLAAGATAYSSRLIHGGLRYLEYGETELVRHSLDERTRLLRLAPHLVHPLRLFIPVENRFGGFVTAAARFFGRPARSSGPRGLWLVRLGLRLYDRYARASQLPRSGVHRGATGEVPAVDARRYPFLCSYYDAQITFPERLVVAMLDDARTVAQQQGLEFNVYTYHRAQLDGETATIFPTDAEPSQPAIAAASADTFRVSAVVNATGAWIDETLRQLQVASPRLIGGTKGSHFVTSHRQLRQLLNSGAIYAEAADGRPVFLLPWGEQSLVGTTDVPFHGPAEQAVATTDELKYLVEAVHSVFPQLKLDLDDIDMHYCGVRPLPHVDAGSKNPAAVTRRHAIVESRMGPIPLYSIVGGKLTTCRQVGEEMARQILQQLGREAAATTRDRVLPGGSYSSSRESELQRAAAEKTGWEIDQIRASWRLLGDRVAGILAREGEARGDGASSQRLCLVDTQLPLPIARHVLRYEWVRHLRDVVERRLMLLYHRGLSQRCLRALAELMVDEGLLSPDDVEAEVSDCCQRLACRFGKRVLAKP